MIDMPADQDHPDEDLDAAFAAIIAGWDDTPDLDDLPDGGAPSSDTAPSGGAPSGGAPSGGDGGDTPRSAPGGEPPHPQGFQPKLSGPVTPLGPTWRARSEQPLGPAERGPAERGPAEQAGHPTTGAPVGPRDWTSPDEPDEGYVPPPPPPLPRASRATALAWSGVLLGPLFLLFCGVFWRTAPRLWLGLAVVGFIAGFVALILRLPADRDGYDGDDGAVV